CSLELHLYVFKAALGKIWWCFPGYAINTLPCGTNGNGKTQAICAALSIHFLKNFSGTS
ncbi:unnamed protein product, partial [Bubo scandiacus]